MICPICMWKGEKFLAKNGRENVLCPKCGSFERHRHQYFVSTIAGVFNGLSEKHVLHVGAKQCETTILKNAGMYVTLDLRPFRGTVVGDLTRTPFRDHTFDLVWASHVLEHIHHVDQAIREIYRILRPSGVALLDVPMYGAKTIFLSEQDKHGHIWHPGSDWPQLYVEAGFIPELFWAEQCPDIYGPLSGSLVAVCRKTIPSVVKGTAIDIDAKANFTSKSC